MVADGLMRAIRSARKAIANLQSARIEARAW